MTRQAPSFGDMTCPKTAPWMHSRVFLAIDIGAAFGKQR